jgi:cell shape-determining protein MreD
MLFVWLLFILALLLEGVLTTLPLTLVFLLTYIILRKEESIFLIAFVAGIILDMQALRPLGQSSIVLILILFTVLLYERKYEIRSLPFIIFATFFASLLYVFVFGYSHIFWQASICTTIALISFLLHGFLAKPKAAKYAYKQQAKKR